MLSLTASNLELTKNAKYSYLSDNYNSAVHLVVVKNSNFVVTNDYILFGEFGSQQSEIIQAGTVDSATHTVNLLTATKFAHPQDTKVSVIRYNQVKFYQTAAATFDSNENYLGTEDVQANRIDTIYQDSTNTTGYGWFVFYNSNTSKATTNSNAIPYAGFEESSVKDIFDAFYSMLNNKEMKLISQSDSYRWLNEGYAKLQNELNLINVSYKVQSEWTVTTANGTQEYSLPSDFGSLVSVTNGDGEPVDFIPLASVPKNDDDETYDDDNAKYFLRGKKIGFSPVPTSADTFYVYYKAKSSALTSYYDSVDIPQNNFYVIVDFMLYRASQKLGKNDAKEHLNNFTVGINNMKIISNKENANKDSFDISNESNV